MLTNVTRTSAASEQCMFDDCDFGQIPFRQTIVVVAIETGMRRGEMLGLVLLDWVADDRSPRKNTPR